MRRQYRSFGSYIRERFGQHVHKVNIDAGFTCPNRDGSLGVSGCVYCNNDSFKPGQCRPTRTIREQVDGGIEYLRRRYRAHKFIAYFQAYTNTYAGVDRLRALYTEALAHPDVIGISIGTRPDCIDAEKLDMIAEVGRGRFVLVEYGIQSIYEKTLRYINRGHDYPAFLDAVRMTRERGMEAGGHLILGFPTETPEETLAMAPEISASGIGFLKLHQLQIIKDTPLAAEYAARPFHVFGYEEYIDFAVRFIERMGPDIVLQRLFATAPDEILVAPKWGNSRHTTTNDIDRAFARLGTCQGRLYQPALSTTSGRT